MKVVTNAGPLMALGKLGELHLLARLYGPVLIPTAVHEEVVLRGKERRRPDAYAVELAIARKELIVTAANDAELSPSVAALPIDRGEKHAIQLGLNTGADWILMDDAVARTSAKAQGLKVKGTIGVLVEAHRNRHLAHAEIDQLFQSILDREDIWISESLLRQVWESLRKGR